MGRRRTASPSDQQGAFIFHEGCSRALNIAITTAHDGVEVTWPAAAGADWDAAFLEVRVIADGVESPHLIVESASRVARQYFAAADQGLRWLNMSFLRDSVVAGGHVTIRQRHMRVAAGTTTLRLFANNLNLAEPILVLAAHPDDAEISAFGLYAGRNATIVTVTAGNAGSAIQESSLPDRAEMYRFKGRIRVIDSVTIPWQGRIPPDRCFNLGYFDARLQDMYECPADVVPEKYTDNCDVGLYRRYNLASLLPDTSRAATWSNLVADVLAVLRKTTPAIVLSPHPQLDSHRDHQFTTVALAEALAHWNEPVTLLLYSSHADDNRYPYGPAGTLMSLPPVADAVVLESVYSHPVDTRTQREKLFALESMHDIRFQDITYLRRAARANELFYVYTEQSIKPLIAKFLTARVAHG